MITALIIDDEAKGRMALREKLISYCPDVDIIGEAADGFAALQLIKQLSPQLIFLDIEMPRMNGFEMLSQVADKNFHIIFTTAYDQYAIKAIKYAALDYLLKPVDIDELKLAIGNIKALQNKSLSKQVELLQQNLSQPKRLAKLAIPSLEGLYFYNIADIVHLEANSNYTIIHLLPAQKIIASRTLKEFEELLPDDIFFRCHHSHLVNLNYIKRYIKGDGGQVELQNGNYVEVSRRKKDEFLQIIGY